LGTAACCTSSARTASVGSANIAPLLHAHIALAHPLHPLSPLTLLVLDLALHAINGVAGLHLQHDGLATQGLHADLRGGCVWGVEGQGEGGASMERALVRQAQVAGGKRVSHQQGGARSHLHPFTQQARRLCNTRRCALLHMGQECVRPCELVRSCVSKHVCVCEQACVCVSKHVCVCDSGWRGSRGGGGHGLWSDTPPGREG